MTSVSWSSPHLATHCQTVWSASLHAALLNHPLTGQVADATHVMLDAEAGMELRYGSAFDDLPPFVAGDLASCYFPDTISVSAGEASQFRVALGLRAEQVLVIFNSQARPGASVSEGVIVAGVSLSSATRRLQDIPIPALALRDLSHLRIDSSRAQASLNFLAAFDGVDTHPVRQRLAAAVLNHADIAYGLVCRSGYADSPPPVRLDFDDDEAAPSTGICRLEPEKGDWGERLARAWFGFVPRGDSLFTYRLMEVVSAGAIPVIVSDGWILPFDELVDWERVGVVVREDDLEGVVERLRDISIEERLRMREELAVLWGKYFRGMEEIVDGIVAVLERRERDNRF